MAQVKKLKKEEYSKTQQEAEKEIKQKVEKQIQQRGTNMADKKADTMQKTTDMTRKKENAKKVKELLVLHLPELKEKELRDTLRYLWHIEMESTK